MNHHRVSGTFTVTMQPEPGPDPAHGVHFGRLRLDKQYQGELQASAQGLMLSAMTATAGSAGYVAIEQVVGTLQGRQGSFVLMHRGVMNRGDRELGITVVPDSGSGELLGLAGKLDIRVEAGQHFYDFDFSLE
jgi:hypothetical protein